MLTEQCQVIEQLDAAHKSNLMHSQIKLVTGRKRGNNTTTCIEDKNGDILMERMRFYLAGLNTLVSITTMTTEVTCQTLPPK